ncbi:hypothetical protein D3C77_751040 [compost metagenome]
MLAIGRPERDVVHHRYTGLGVGVDHAIGSHAINEHCAAFTSPVVMPVDVIS